MYSRIVVILCALLAFLAPAAGGEKGPKANREPIYEVDGRGMERVDQALAEAQRDDKRVLLTIGGNWCGWCYKLHDLFHQNDEAHRLLQGEYVLVPIDSAADKGVTEKWQKGLSA